MWKPVLALDRILRGEATSVPALREAEFNVPLVSLSGLIELLGISYGLCMGVFAMTGGNHEFRQLLACMFKVPALFVLTLLVTLPSLYVFNAMVGSRLMFLPMLRLLVAALGVMLAVLASFGPIIAFFSFTTSSYPFMVLLNVIVFAISGLLGLAFLLQTLHRLSIAYVARREVTPPPIPPPVPELIPGSAESPTVIPGPLDSSGDHVLGNHVRTVFRTWVVVFGLVGAQMAWVLRPFVGNPSQPFTWFRPTESGFFEAVLHCLRSLL